MTNDQQTSCRTLGCFTLAASGGHVCFPKVKNSFKNLNDTYGVKAEQMILFVKIVNRFLKDKNVFLWR